MIVGDGRPLRFLALIGGGWVAARLALVWHVTGSLPDAVREIVPLPRRAIAATVPAPPPSPPTRIRLFSGDKDAVRFLATPVSATAAALPIATAGASGRRPALPAARLAGPAEERSAIPAVTAPVESDMARAPSTRRGASRLSMSAWMIARDGTGLGAAALSPQLGGTQGGVRIDYALTRGIAATGRIAAPAAGAGRELSLGVAWRPKGVPLRFVAEYRLALDRGRSGPALGVSGGVSAVTLPADFRLEGYGQAGAILRDGVETYVDASVRAARPVAVIGATPLDLGGGAWGGAQRGVARLDIGPSIGARVPLAGQEVRVSLDWRQRIAGNARPGSGPALTLGTDF